MSEVNSHEVTPSGLTATLGKASAGLMDPNPDVASFCYVHMWPVLISIIQRVRTRSLHLLPLAARPFCLHVSALLR